jgi:NAD(P)-dependent dehydrogenase (short-subunit alcohol dehydrogenase family)
VRLLDGKAVLVTGGTTGLGRAIAQRFLEEGAAIVLTGRDEELGARAETDLRERGSARFVRADAASSDDVRASVALAADVLGGLDVLVNNAGIGVAASALDTPLADFDTVMAVNVRGYLAYAQAAFPLLRERGGCIVHISSDVGVFGDTNMGVYSVSKAAVNMLSNVLALECGPHGVRSNAICPGDIEPGMRHMAPPGEEAGQEDPAQWWVPPVGRLGRAADVASAAAFLASEEASFCNGIALVVDGGMRAGYRAGRPPPGGE